MISRFGPVCLPGLLLQKRFRISAAHPFESSSGNGATQCGFVIRPAASATVTAFSLELNLRNLHRVSMNDAPLASKHNKLDDPYDASMENLRKARASERWHPPRPWRSKEETLMIRRFVLWWYTCRDSKPSARNWARQLGISHVWLLKVVRRLKEDPDEVRRLQAYGDPTLVCPCFAFTTALCSWLPERTGRRCAVLSQAQIGPFVSEQRRILAFRVALRNAED
jgi:hypothetical protein